MPGWVAAVAVASAAFLPRAASGQRPIMGIADSRPSTGPVVVKAADIDNEKSLTLATTVRPMAVPRPALKYRLLVPPAEQVPGNAAPLYMTAAARADEAGDIKRVKTPLSPEALRRFGFPSADGEIYDYWPDVFQHARLDKLDSPEIRDFLSGSIQTSLPLLEIAARRESCNWEVPVKEMGFAALLPHLSGMRMLSNSLRSQARLQLARGDVAAAVHTIQVTIAMAKALDEQAMLVQHYVGVGICNVALETLREATAQPDCPNLYWALADLPKPMFNVRNALEGERASIHWSIPEFDKAKAGTFTDADWRTMTARFAQLTQAGNGLGGPTDLWSTNGLGPFVASATMMPYAKAYLIGTGMTAEQVDAMPQSAVLGRYMAQAYDEAFDEAATWADLPYFVAKTGRARTDARIKKFMVAGNLNPFIRSVGGFPRSAVHAVLLDRQIAAMQTTEALRAYAATHAGALPATLKELIDTPAPADPTTGKPFAYRVDGRTATIESPVPPGERPNRGLVMRVTMTP